VNTYLKELKKITKARRAFLLLGFGTSMFWLFCLFLWPANWADSHGYNQLGYLMLASVIHLLAGAVLFGAARAEFVPLAFALSVLCAPIMHFVGSFTEFPVCLLFFVLPAIATFGTGIRSFIRKPD
jgi:hypothetical protein